MKQSRILLRSALLVAVLVIISLSPGVTAEIINWDDPDAIDPLAPETDDYMDVYVWGVFLEGDGLYENGEYLEALKKYLYVSRSNYDCELTHYNIACCYALLGEAESAAKYLGYAFDKGFTDWDTLNNDKDFDAIRDKPVFAAKIEELTKNKVAKEAVKGELITIEARKPFECRVKLPKGYNPQQTQTLLIGLHGGIGRADRFIKLFDDIDDVNFIYAAPQGQYEKILYKSSVYGWGQYDTETHLPLDTTKELTPQYILDTITALENRYAIDKTYLMGYSEGAYYALTVGLTHPERIEGIICLSAMHIRELSEKELVAAKQDSRVLMEFGENEPGVAIGKKVCEKLEKLGCEVTFQEFPGAHEVGKSKLLHVLEWLEQE